MAQKTMPSKAIGIKTKKIQARLGAVTKAMTKDKTNMNGDLMTVLMVIWKANWTLDTSVVDLVTIEEVENLSMLLKANF